MPARHVSYLMGVSVPYRTGNVTSSNHNTPISYPLTCGHSVNFSVRPNKNDLLLCVKCDYKSVKVNWDRFNE